MSLPTTPPPQKKIVSNHINETETFVSTNQNQEKQDENSVTNNENDDNGSIKIAFGNVGPEPRPENQNRYDSGPQSSTTDLVDVGEPYNGSYEELIKETRKNSTPQNSQQLTTEPEDSPIANVSKSFTV